MEIGPIRLSDIVIFFTIVGGTVALLRWLAKIWKRVNRIMEDIEGVDSPDPGHPRKPGMMERDLEHDRKIAEGNRLLRMHIKESRKFAEDVTKRAAEQGIEVPEWPSLDDEDT